MIKEKLEDLDGRIMAAVQTIPPENRKLLTYHDSFPFFGARYGFEIIGAVQPSDFTEPSARFDAEGVELRAEAAGDGYVLNGTKLFIPDAHVADKMVVVARTGGSGEDGITLFLVDGKATGVTSTVLKTIAADKQCEVKFENVQVGADAVLGTVGGGWETMRQLQRRATVAYCAYLVGLAQRD